MKRQREGIMLAYPLELKRLERWGFPFYVQPKLDGMRMRVELSTPNVNMLSSTGRRLNFALPHIELSLNCLAEELHSHGIFELDGELYYHHMPFEDIVGICQRTKTPHHNHWRMQYHIFDHISEDPFSTRINDFPPALAEWHPCKLVDTAKVENMQDLTTWLNICISTGYEGIILRHPNASYERKRSSWMMKFKPSREDTYKIEGVIEEVSIHGEAKGTLGSLILSDPEGNIFHVGTGLTEHLRNILWESRSSLKGMGARIKYQHITKGGVPRFPVFIEVTSPNEID